MRGYPDSWSQALLSQLLEQHGGADVGEEEKPSLRAGSEEMQLEGLMSPQITISLHWCQLTAGR